MTRGTGIGRSLMQTLRGSYANSLVCIFKRSIVIPCIIIPRLLYLPNWLKCSVSASSLFASNPVYFLSPQRNITLKWIRPLLVKKWINKKSQKKINLQKIKMKIETMLNYHCTEVIENHQILQLKLSKMVSMNVVLLYVGGASKIEGLWKFSSVAVTPWTHYST